MNLSHLTDSALIKDTKLLAQKERSIGLDVLFHLKEIERRRLFSDLGYSSLFDYCVRELKYSDAAASRRVRAARLISDQPQITENINEGSLNLSILSMASQLFKNEGITNKEKKKRILKELENKSTREGQKVILSFTQNPPLPKEDLRVVGDNLNSLKVIIKDETLEKFQEVKALLGHKAYSNDEILNKVLTLAIEQIKKRKFGKVAKSGSISKTRYIPNSMKRKVFERDRVCQKCGGIYKLEFDHIRPYALGGESTAENLRLLCHSCNQRARINQYNQSSYRI